jgi:hypothetical protein
MKKILYLLLTIFLAEISFSQENFSFVDDDMEWSYLTVRSSEFQGPSYRVTTRKKYFGDTVINDVHYKKMFESKDNGKTWDELGYYRENGKKVYRIAKGETTERACLDFNIEPEKDEYYYIEVDSLTILGQQVPKYNYYHLYETGEAEYPYVKELVGSIIDEIGYVDWDRGVSGAPDYTGLLCVHKGNELLWQNPSYEKCYYSPYSVIELNAENSTLLQESNAHKNSDDSFDDELHFQLKGNVLYISGTLELPCFSRGDWLLYTMEENTISLEADVEDGWIISKDRLFSLHSLKIDGCTADQYEITFRGKTYSVNRNTSVSTLNDQISLSPNPVKDILTLTLPTDNNEIKIFDLQGKLFLQQNVGFSAEINVLSLKTGTYVLVVNDTESITFIKQ